MRILTRTRIYRAFPELDRYSDEHCRRFVRAARGGWLRRGLVVGALWVEAMAGLALSIAALIWAYGSTDRLPLDFDLRPVRAGVFAGLLLVAAALPLLLTYLTRDWLLRRRVRYVLRTRGTCPSCRYSLVGMPVRADNLVICPECGMETKVDPSLGELTVDEAGRPRFKPSEHIGPAARFLTPRRKRIIKRAALWVGIGVFVGLPSMYGAYELWLRSQAAKAAADMTGAADIAAYVQSVQPPDADPGLNFYTALEAAISAMDGVDAAVWRNNQVKASTGDVVYPEFSLIYARSDPNRPGRTERDAANEQAATDLAIELIDAYAKAGVYDHLAEAAARRYAARPAPVTPGQPLFTVLLPDLGKSRQLARVCAARMEAARAKGDAKQYGEALEQMLALARASRCQPFLIDDLVGIAIESMALSRVRVALESRPDAALLDEIARALKAQECPLDPADPFEGERLASRDTIAWFFSDPANVRMGPYSKGARSLASISGTNVIAGRLGTYSQNQAAAKATFDTLTGLARLEPYQRPMPAPPALNQEPSLFLQRAIVPATGNALASIDLIELQRRACRVMLALERHRVTLGFYPERLDDLAPRFIGELPIDPWSGKPFVYRRVEPGSESPGRGFVLYSVGSDRTDDGGKGPADPRSIRYYITRYPPDPSAAGLDLVLSDPEP